MLVQPIAFWDQELPALKQGNATCKCYLSKRQKSIIKFSILFTVFCYVLIFFTIAPGTRKISNWSVWLTNLIFAPSCMVWNGNTNTVTAPPRSESNRDGFDVVLNSWCSEIREYSRWLCCTVLNSWCSEIRVFQMALL